MKVFYYKKLQIKFLNYINTYNLIIKRIFFKLIFIVSTFICKMKSVIYNLRFNQL
jgi:hypothetical protein